MSPPGPFRQTTQMVSIKLCPPKPVYSVSLYFHFSCICICIRICNGNHAFFSPGLSQQATQMQCPDHSILSVSSSAVILLYLVFFMSVFVFLYVCICISFCLSSDTTQKCPFRPLLFPASVGLFLPLQT